MTQSSPTRGRNPGFVDFKEVKAHVNIVQVLEHYDLMANLNRAGDRLSGACPIHQGSNPTQFRVSISKNCFNCFGNCGRGGNVIDFVSLMEEVSFREAALLLQDWFFPGNEVASPGGNRHREEKETRRSSDHPTREPDPSTELANRDEDIERGDNPPLTFELKSLSPDHPYFKERGISPEAVTHFGLGYCSRGCLRGRIAIPIHNPRGDLVAYSGRWPGVPPEGEPRYKLPKGFRKSLEVFNLHRAMAEPEALPLVIVEGFFDCIALWEAGISKCVALMGNSLSPAQEERLTEIAASEIEILFDSDDAGAKGADRVSRLLAPNADVRLIQLPDPGMQPDHLSAEEMAVIFE